MSEDSFDVNPDHDYGPSRTVLQLRAEIERLRADIVRAGGASELLREGMEAEIRGLRTKCHELQVQITQARRVLEGKE